MPTKSPEKQLETFISRYTPEVAGVARDALAILREMVPNAIIMVYDNYNALAIGFGPNEKAGDAILSIALYPRWVNLFLLQGAGLPDPHKLLRGSGKKVRHLVLENAEVLNTPEVMALIQAALEKAKVPIDSTCESKLIIKFVSANQRPRRPGSPKGSK